MALKGNVKAGDMLSTTHFACDNDANENGLSWRKGRTNQIESRVEGKVTKERRRTGCEAPFCFSESA